MTQTDGRRQRSRRTRALIVEAATRLFLERGYLGTTIEGVGEAAGVATQTVYYVFGTKPNLLAAVLDATIAGDVEPVALLDRPWFDAVEDETDASTAVAQLVITGVAIIARTAPIYEVVRRAAADPEVGALLDGNRRRRREDQRRLVEILHRSGHLRAGLAIEEGTDIFYGLINEEVFLLLTADCGWDQARFGQWATRVLVHELVGPPHAP
jgi:AcrR family transcriptional regulator